MGDLVLRGLPGAVATTDEAGIGDRPALLPRGRNSTAFRRNEHMLQRLVADCRFGWSS
jgi:hypothetical protein